MPLISPPSGFLSKTSSHYWVKMSWPSKPWSCFVLPTYFYNCHPPIGHRCVTDCCASQCLHQIFVHSLNPFDPYTHVGGSRKRLQHAIHLWQTKHEAVSTIPQNSSKIIRTLGADFLRNFNKRTQMWKTGLRVITVKHVALYVEYMCICIFVHCAMSSALSINQLEHCIEAAHLVALAVEEKVAGTSKNEQKLIKSSVALMLFLLGKLDNFHSSQDSSITKLAGDMKICGLQKIHQCLSQWLQRGRHTVDDSYSGILSYSRQELKV